MLLVLLRYDYLSDVGKVKGKELGFLKNHNSCSAKFNERITKNGYF